MSNRVDFETQWKKNHMHFSNRRLGKGYDQRFTPSRPEEQKVKAPKYDQPKDTYHGSPKSIVYQTLDEKTDNYIERQRIRIKLPTSTKNEAKLKRKNSQPNFSTLEAQY